MTDSNSTDETASGRTEGSDSLEEVAEDGPLPETEHVDEAAATGRDTSETEDPGDNRDTDGVAGGVILGGISQSR
jgi:hypothetical protein